MARVFSAALLTSVSAVITFDWSDCGTAGTHAKVNSVTVTPEVPVAGDNITIVASVDVDKDTTAINSDLVLAKLLHHKFDGCVGKEFDLPLNIGKIIIPAPEDGCPVTAGTHNFVRYVQLSENIPAASTTSKLTGKDQDGEDFVCVSMTLSNEKDEVVV